MAANKYKMKDVVFLQGREAKIVQLYGDRYFVEFTDKKDPDSMLITDEEIESMSKPISLPVGQRVSWWQPGYFDSPSNKTEIKTDELIEKYVDPNTHCPKCGTEWKETYINHEAVYDCLKCKVKKEDIV